MDMIKGCDKEKMSKMKYCGNCKQWITPTKGVSWLIAIILLIFLIVPGIIYIIWAASKGGKCPMCNSTNIIWAASKGGKCPMCNSTNWSIPPKEEEKKE
jgi:flagellar basal body-associated protein FliL